MKHLFSLFFLFLLMPVCHGQELPLQQCIQMGIARNRALANARIGVEKGQTAVTQNRSRLLPVLNGMLQTTLYVKSPVNVTTGTLLGNDFPDNPTWQTIKSMPYNANAGLQLSVPLYDATIFVSVDVARAMEKIASLSYEKAEEELIVQISKAYFLAQASQEQQRLTNENILRMEKLCTITEALYEQGVVMEVDLNRVRINLKNLLAQHDQCVTLHEQQLNLLRYLMDVAPEDPLEVTHMAADIAPLPTAEMSVRLPELLLSVQQKTLAEQRIKTVRAGYLPSVSFLGYAGALGYQEKFHHFFHTSAAHDNWWGNCYVGLSVRIPLFDGNAKKLQIKQHRLEALQAANRMEQTKKHLSESYQNAQLQLSHNMEVLRTQKESRAQAENVYNVTEEQYKEGVASMTALLQDEMQLRTTQTACVQVLCQCLLAKLDLLRLSGNLGRLSGD